MNMKKFISGILTVSVMCGFVPHTLVANADNITGSVVTNAGGAVTMVDTSVLPDSEHITEYLVTTAKNNEIVKQYTTDVSDEITADTNGADRVEITPVYEYSDLNDAASGVTLPDGFEDGLYNITVTNGSTVHTDLYVNGYMAANNIDQNGEGRSVSTGSAYTASDVKIEGGEITLKTLDSPVALSYAKIVKSPSIVDRKTKIYIMGDSLVANYYGGNEDNYLGTTQTGWGQVLSKFIDTDKYEIVNLANAGHYAVNLCQTALPGVIYNSQEGDMLLFEAGVNDKWHPYDENDGDKNKRAMTEAVTDAVNQAKGAGLKTVLVNPNSLPSDCSKEVCLGQVMLDVAKEKDVQSIDLSGISCDFLTNVYNGDTAAIEANFGIKKDVTHSSYLGAMKYASIVAGELYKLGYTDMINTGFEYTRNDTYGNKIVCKAVNNSPEFSGATLVHKIDSIVEKSDTEQSYDVSLNVFDTNGDIINENVNINWSCNGGNGVTFIGNGVSGTVKIAPEAEAGEYKITAAVNYGDNNIKREISFLLTSSRTDLLFDGGFEDNLMTSGTDWKFTGGSGWYSYGTAGGTSDKAKNGSNSAYASSGAIGQRITLEAGVEYTMSVNMYSDTAITNGSSIGFYDGTKTWPMSNEVQIDDLIITSEQTGKWTEYTAVFTPPATQEYVLGAFVAAGSKVYFDDFGLKEKEENDKPITTPSVTATPSATAAPSATATPSVTATPSATVQPKEKCIKITAKYKNDGTLEDIKTEEINVSDITPVNNTATEKTFYWESLESMKPIDVDVPVEADYTFTFGTTAEGDSIAVNGAVPYGSQTDGMTYGFFGIDGSPDITDGKTDGFVSNGDEPDCYLTNGTVNGHSYVAVDYSQYNEETITNMGDAVMPVRFGIEAEQHKYYTVTATVVNTSATENTEVTLFSEKRHNIMFKKQLAPGERVTKTFNVNLESVYYNGSGIKDDNIINVTVMGKNAGLEKVSIKKHENMGKTIWLCTDSTGCDQSASVPYYPLRNYGGVGSALPQYINPEIAVSNQGEMGLEARDNDHFNNAVKYMKAGDYLYVQYGFNDGSTEVFKSNLEKYYTAAHKKGVKLIIVSPTERRNTNANYDFANNKWTSSNAGYAAAGKAFVEDKIAKGAEDIAFIDLNTAVTEWMNSASEKILAQRKKAGFGDTAVSPTAMDYYYLCGWEIGVDTVHMNDAGADNAAYLVAELAKTIIAENPNSVQAKVLADLVANAPENTPYTITDDIVEDGWAPNSHYPYPSSTTVEFDYPTMVKSVDVSDGKLNSMTVKVQGAMNKYALGVAEILDEGGSTVKTIYTKSTDINSSIGHIDNSGAKYGDIITMYFDESENTLENGYSYKVYLLPIDNGASKPDSKPMYSSVYTEQPKVLSYLISGTDGKSSEMFDYNVEEGTDIAGLGANTTTGTNTWQYVGSSSYTKHNTAVKDTMTAVDLYNNGSGTFSLTKYFNNYSTVSSGKVHMHFQAAFILGSFTVKLTTSTKAASWMDGMTVMSVSDGYVHMYDGTEAGQLKNGKWTDIDIWIDLDRGTESVSIAGGEPTECDIAQLQTTNINDTASLIPLRGVNFIYTAHPLTSVSYTFETYITDLSVTSVETDTPQVTAMLDIESGCEDMGSVSGGRNYNINSDVTVMAKPNEGYVFRGWYKDGELYSKDKSLTINRMREDISLTAKFAVQKHKEDVAYFEIGADKQAVKVGSTLNLYPENVQDSEGGEIEEVTASDITWSCNENGITIDANGVLTVGSGFSIDANSVKTITVTGTINTNVTATRVITVYSYAYYEEMSEKSTFDGTVKTIANKSAIVWPGGNSTSVYTLSAPVMLDKDTTITYSNIWSGENTAGQYRYITFKDDSNNEVLKLYYFWTDLCVNADTKLGAISKDAWTDITIAIKNDGNLTIRGNGNQIETSIPKASLTNIAKIELSSAKNCPDAEKRALGIGKISILQ